MAIFYAGNEEGGFARYLQTFLPGKGRFDHGGGRSAVLERSAQLRGKGASGANNEQHGFAEVAAKAGSAGTQKAAGVVGSRVCSGAGEGYGARQCSFGKARQIPMREEVGSGVNNHRQAAPRRHDRLQLVVGTDGSGQRSEQANPRQFGFGLVVVDVVFADDSHLRCITRLAGAEDDAHGAAAKIVANLLDQVETGAFMFHDHIEDGYRDVFVGLNGGNGFFRRIGMNEVERPPIDADVLQREQRGVMNLGVVVHDHDAPRAMIAMIEFSNPVGEVVDDVQVVVVRGAGHWHLVVSDYCIVLLSLFSTGAHRGIVSIKVVPAPTRLSTEILPPRTRVTML